ncbi:TonB-dependent receptor plug domain-containing protein [Planctomycetota bacterium]
MNSTILRGFLALALTPALMLMPAYCIGEDSPPAPRPAADEPEKVPATDADGDDLFDLSLDDLMEISVITVSRQKGTVFTSPAAVHVITQEDIRRSGVTSIAGALRMVPGMQVGRLSSRSWAVSARGDQSQFARKLLVLVDGRSAYSPIFAGTNWDEQDLVLEDIDRIEVVRGPGGSLWGANAMNAVINVVTKSSEETQGSLLSVGAGTLERATTTYRYGGKLSDNAFYRVYGKYRQYGEFVDGSGDGADDEWSTTRGGFRVDRRGTDNALLTIQGDAYTGDIEDEITVAAPVAPFTAVEDGLGISGVNLLARWTSGASDTREISLQGYFDNTVRDYGTLEASQNTFDLDFQMHSLLAGRHDVIWGLGCRVVSDDLNNSFAVQVGDDSETYSVFSGFVQDEIALREELLYLTVGTKIEHNDFSGVEIQPSIRLAYTPNDTNCFWAAASRAVRTPTRGDTDVRINLGVAPAPFAAPPGTLVYYSLFPNDDLDATELIAVEVGYRTKAVKTLTLDSALFYHRYRNNIATSGIGTPYMETDQYSTHFVIPIAGRNDSIGEEYGVEADLNWQATQAWRLRTGYALLKQRDINDEDEPANRGHLISQWNLSRNLELDAALYYVSKNFLSNVPAYTRADIRIGWRPVENLDISIVGQSLFDDRQQEYDGFGISTGLLGQAGLEMPRSVHLIVTWKF